MKAYKRMFLSQLNQRLVNDMHGLLDLIKGKQPNSKYQWEANVKLQLTKNCSKLTSTQPGSLKASQQKLKKLSKIINKI